MRAGCQDAPRRNSRRGVQWRDAKQSRLNPRPSYRGSPPCWGLAQACCDLPAGGPTWSGLTCMSTRKPVRAHLRGLKHDSRTGSTGTGEAPPGGCLSATLYPPIYRERLSPKSVLLGGTSVAVQLLLNLKLQRFPENLVPSVPPVPQGGAPQQPECRPAGGCLICKTPQKTWT
jgi:hypothetical protein